ncbi:hypothetical protein I656_02838 [Geobacillus sp. WSUCF1]|nr:hypothetical protein I656_02838 [Geobacillus sp. WSUCF1]
MFSCFDNRPVLLVFFDIQYDRFHQEVNMMGAWHGNSFALIVVLFILLIIVGCACLGGYAY